MNLESANLVLRTSSKNIVKGDVNVNGYNNDVTWNIDLQQCLGPMYNKYARFKICLTSVGAGVPSPALSDDNRTLNINVEGFQWVNGSYNSVTGTINTNAILACVTAGTSTAFTNNFTGEVGYVFDKPKSGNVSVRIYLTKISDGTIVAIQYPPFCYCFSIYGIDE